ncbi:MAG: hypothetical protein HQK53_16975, partial [Oligoflexia bacterium]|nr:hypothetical protein [Oligoflexia bacterium]
LTSFNFLSTSAVVLGSLGGSLFLALSAPAPLRMVPGFEQYNQLFALSSVFRFMAVAYLYRTIYGLNSTSEHQRQIP